MSDPRVISFKCECFKFLGSRHIYPRNDGVVETVRFSVESLQTSRNLVFRDEIPQAAVPNISVRPSRVHSRQLVGLSIPLPECKYEVFVSWFSFGSVPRFLILDGIHRGGMLDVTLTMPRLPKDRMITIELEANGEIYQRPIWSNGDKVNGRWEFDQGGAVEIEDYCCRNGQVNNDPCEEDRSFQSYEDPEICRVVLLSFITRGGLIDGEPSIDLSEFANSGLPVHTRWSLEEIGYYGVERPVVYKWGEVIDGTLVGLPPTWSPPNFTYPGYMNLTLRC